MLNHLAIKAAIAVGDLMPAGLAAQATTPPATSPPASDGNITIPTRPPVAPSPEAGAALMNLIAWGSYFFAICLGLGMLIGLSMMAIGSVANTRLPVMGAQKLLWVGGAALGFAILPTIFNGLAGA